MPKRSAAGLPDLILVGPDAARGVVWAELKSARGVLRPEQVAFIAALRAAGQTVYVWKPSQWDEILEVLG